MLIPMYSARAVRTMVEIIISTMPEGQQAVARAQLRVFLEKEDAEINDEMSKKTTGA